MSLSRCCVVLKFAAAGRSLAALTVVGLALAGCATDEQHRQEAYARHAQAVAQAMPLRGHGEPELEDDGLPSQTPPPANRRQEPDDPREPFSPNYGQPLPPPLRTTATDAPIASSPRSSYASAN